MLRVISLPILLAMLSASSVFASPESTPWGSYDFPLPIHHPRDARATYAEARLPIVIAVRFLASADSADTPWIHPSLACGDGRVRKDLTAAMVRASTLGAAELVAALDEQIAGATALRNGTPVSTVLRYAGPVHVVLEPMRITVEGEAVPQLPVVEPHLRVFVSASVPRCAVDATGAFGLLGEITSSFMITASSALELGWPSYAMSAQGQRIVMATDNMLTDGFCCGQEASFGLDTLISVFDYRDYRYKDRLRNTIRRLATSRQRDRRWMMQVRDAFGVPDRFPSGHVQQLRYGTGRLAPNEFVVWPARTDVFASESPQALPVPADFLMALAGFAHSRAELISPAILESYDPERRYSFVGWPEEFLAWEPTAEREPASASTGGRILEVFGAERRFSFVGSADALDENIDFAFAAWQLQTAYSQSQVTDRFRAAFTPTAEMDRFMRTLLRMEAQARRERQPGSIRSVLAGGEGPAAYAAALASVGQPLRFLDHASTPEASLEQGTAGEHLLQWHDQQIAIDAKTVTDLYLSLVDLYKTRFATHLAGPSGGE